MSFDVNPDTLFQASVKFLDDRRWTDTVLGALMSELSGTQGMAGADVFIGEKFAKQYDAAAGQAAEGLAKLDVHLGQIASGLLGSATNYWRADSASNMQFPIDTAAPAQQLECDQAYAFKKEQVPTAQGAGVDTWDVIADTALAAVWPQGDTGKMRKAAQAWTKTAQFLSRLDVEVGTAVTMVTGPNTGDTITAFGSHCAQLVGNACLFKPVQGGPAIPNLQAYCAQLATYCDTAADKIDEARSQVKDLLIAAGLIAAAGVLLTVFTFGASDAAAGAIDAGLIAEAEGIVIAAEATIAAELSATMVAEIETYLASLSAVRVISGSFIIAGSIVLGGIVLGPGGSPAYAAPGIPAPPGGPGGLGSSWPELTQAEKDAFDAWKKNLFHRPEGRQGPEYNYQRRVAGPDWYEVPAGPGEAIRADGLRSADGAYVEAKYTHDPKCTVYSLDNATGRPDFLYQKILGEQDSEVRRYTDAINNPANKGKFLEVDCNDPALVPYYQALMLKNHTPGRVIVVP